MKPTCATLHLLLASCALVVLQSGQAQQAVSENAQQIEPETYLKLLGQCTRFETGRIGEGGRKSDVVAAFDILRKRANSSEVFEKLVETEISPAALCYALMGLHAGDKQRYFVHKFRLKDEVVIDCLWYGTKRKLTGKEIKALIESGELLKAMNWSPKKINPVIDKFREYTVRYTWYTNCMWEQYKWTGHLLKGRHALK